MEHKAYIAIDLGASSGRSILGLFDGSRLEIEELNRFDNSFVKVGGEYYWDILFLYTNIIDSLKKFGRTKSAKLCGIGIDTWGVDFGLIDAQGRLIGNLRAYRDLRALRGMKAFQQKYGQRAAFDITGTANYEYNTLYQLYDMIETEDPQLKAADKLLLMPDLISYMLCGRVSCEFTHASTTQMLDAKGGWSTQLADMMGITPSLLPMIQMSGEKKADLYEDIGREAGLDYAVPVYCVGSHDTASAVASVPASNDNYAFLSSGTWSLIGIETDEAVINDAVYSSGLTNEGTVTGDKRLLKNIMGLWIIQNCKRQWDSQGKTSWDDIVAEAQAARPFSSFIDVNAHDLFDGENIIQKIQSYCRATGQSVPQTKGETARIVYESLAMCYKEAFDELERIKGSRIDVLHIVGGGSNNKLLNQMTANSLNRTVVAGPAEATAIGNLMMQVKASGEVKNLAEMRQVIRDSFNVERYEPQQTDDWTENYYKYIKIKSLYKG